MRPAERFWTKTSTFVIFDSPWSMHEVHILNIIIKYPDFINKFHLTRPNSQSSSVESSQIGEFLSHSGNSRTIPAREVKLCKVHALPHKTADITCIDDCLSSFSTNIKWTNIYKYWISYWHLSMFFLIQSGHGPKFLRHSGNHARWPYQHITGRSVCFKSNVAWLLDNSSQGDQTLQSSRFATQNSWHHLHRWLSFIILYQHQMNKYIQILNFLLTSLHVLLNPVRTRTQIS